MLTAAAVSHTAPEPVVKNTSKSFSGTNWGQSACDWALMTVQISDRQWDCICEDSNTFNVLDKDGVANNVRGDAAASLSGNPVGI